MLQTLNDDVVNLVTTFLTNSEVYVLKCTSKKLANVLSGCSYFKTLDYSKTNARRRYLIQKEKYFQRIREFPTQGLYGLFCTTMGRHYLINLCTPALQRTFRRIRRSALRDIKQREALWYTQSGFFAWIQERAWWRTHSNISKNNPVLNTLVVLLTERKKHLSGPYKSRSKTLTLEL